MQTFQGTESEGTKVTLNSKQHSVFIAHLTSISQVLGPPHPSFNSTPPHVYLYPSTNTVLQIRGTASLIGSQVQWKQSNPSFSPTEKFHGILTSSSFLTCDSDFLPLTSFSLVLIPQPQPVPEHLPSSNVDGHLSCLDLVISWPVLRVESFYPSP